MPAKPVISRITSHKVSSGNEYLHPYLTNVGDDVLPVGTVKAKQSSKDGTVKSVSFFNSTPLSPGETTKLITQVFDAKTISLQSYSVNNKPDYPMNYTLTRGFFGWSVR